LGLAALALIGCGGQTTRPEPVPEDVPGAFVAAVCQHAVACGQMPDLATCRTAVSVPSTLAARLTSLREGRVVYHADRMAECLTRWVAASCSLSEVLAANAICASAFEGVVPYGASCVDSAECRAADCEFVDCTGACCAGTCGLPPSHQAAVGEGCTTTGDCIAGSICGLQARCVAVVGEGEACADDVICGTYQACVGGVCTRPAARGQACHPELNAFACDRVDDYCDPGTRICLARHNTGEACVIDDGSGNAVGCVQADWCDAGTCQPLPTVGEACANTALCLPGLLCNPTSGLCVSASGQPACGV